MAVVAMLPYLGALVLAVLVSAFVSWISLGFLHQAPGSEARALSDGELQPELRLRASGSEARALLEADSGKLT